jgi:hypothetical protein
MKNIKREKPGEEKRAGNKISSFFQQILKEPALL